MYEILSIQEDWSLSPFLSWSDFVFQYPLIHSLIEVSGTSDPNLDEVLTPYDLMTLNKISRCWFLVYSKSIWSLFRSFDLVNAKLHDRIFKSREVGLLRMIVVWREWEKKKKKYQIHVSSVLPKARQNESRPPSTNIFKFPRFAESCTSFTSQR